MGILVVFTIIFDDPFNGDSLERGLIMLEKRINLLGTFFETDSLQILDD